MNFDVAIVGGGPSGAMVGSLLKVLDPNLSVAIVEAATFPRDHVGESLLPTACAILNEAGCWGKIEAAGFPIKLGAFYRWGQTPDLIKFTFLDDPFTDRARPGVYEGQRLNTTWQVDRATFDDLLLRHASELGCQVFQNSPVLSVDREGDRVTALRCKMQGSREERITAKYYVDASGTRGMIRKAFDVPVDSPTSLRNIAIWDYWQNADWLDREGEGTFIRILSLEWGWLWFITIGETRTSVGLVTSADYFKKSKLSTEELYSKAIAEEPNIGPLLSRATRENCLQADKDWSYISSRISGENWFLTGDSCGFADPILSAGITLALSGARKVAYTIKELESGSLDADWVKSEYDRTHRANINSHIRFADYWYSANKTFVGLQEYCSEIAKDSGISLEPRAAFRWIATGGFTDDYGDQPVVGTYTLSAVKWIIGNFTGEKPELEFLRFTHLRLNTEGSQLEKTATYRAGKIVVKECYRRGEVALVIDAYYRSAILALSAESETGKVIKLMCKWIQGRIKTVTEQQAIQISLEILEAMYAQGWVEGRQVLMPA